MKTWHNVLTTLAAFAVAGLSACSAQPDRPAETATAARSATAAPAPSGGGTTTETTAVQPTGKVPAGYRRVTRGGKEYFCRSETTLGTKLPETFCYTRDQLKVISERTDTVMDAVGRGCAGAGCGAE